MRGHYVEMRAEERPGDLALSSSASSRRGALAARRGSGRRKRIGPEVNCVGPRDGEADHVFT